MALVQTITRIHSSTFVSSTTFCLLLLLLGAATQRCEASPAGRYRRDASSCPLPTGLTCDNLLAGSSPATTSAAQLVIQYSSTTPQPTTQTEQSVRDRTTTTYNNHLHPLANAYSTNIEISSDYRVLSSSAMQQEWSLKNTTSAKTLLDVLGNFYGLYSVYNCSINYPGEKGSLILENNNTNIDRIRQVYTDLRDILHLVCGAVSDEDKSLTNYRTTTNTIAPEMRLSDSHTVRATFVNELSDLFARLKNSSNWGN